jgi:flagellar hook-length control protein FliK
LKVTLSIQDNQAQIMFMSEHAAVRQAVDAAMPQLRMSFADNGISLGQTTVGSQSDQPAPQDGSPAQYLPGRRRPTDTGAAAATGPERADIIDPQPRARGSALDTFA